MEKSRISEKFLCNTEIPFICYKWVSHILPTIHTVNFIYFQFGEQHAKLDQMIRDFRLGKINVIVSTAILEEGNEKAFY